MITTRTLTLIAICSLVICLPAGCAVSPQAKYYRLTPIPAQQAVKQVDDANKIKVNIAPVEIPDFLNRQQIVTRDGQNELKLAEFDRWGGSLPENISVVLAENISLLLGSERVFAHPRAQSATPDCTVAVRILQLDSLPGEQVRLKAQWTVLSGSERKETVTRISEITEKLGDKKFETLVAAVSLALEKLSGEIAQAVRAFGTIPREGLPIGVEKPVSETEETFPCIDEIENFCKEVQPGAGRLLQCLGGHEKDLGKVCLSKYNQVRNRVEEAKALCAADLLTFCADVKPGDGRLLKCLQGKLSNISPECRGQVEAFGGVQSAKPVQWK